MKRVDKPRAPKAGGHVRHYPKASDASRARLLQLSGIIKLRGPGPSTYFLDTPEDDPPGARGRD
jgi:hypothetical protein